MSGRDLLALGDLASLFSADTSGPCAKPDAPPPPPFGDAVLVDVSLPRNLRLMARVLFAPESPFQVDWCTRIGATSVNEGPWEARAADGAGGAAVAMREVLMATPPPPAWGYIVGNTPIGSKRQQTMTMAREGQAVCVEETNHLSMPFGNTFHTALQYYLAAEGPSSTRLRVSFKMHFSMRAAAMKGVLTSMVRGEHIKVFEQWSAALQEFLSGPPPSMSHGLPPLRVASGAPSTPRAPSTPVAAIVSRAPVAVAAVFGAGAMAGAAAAILCAAVLHTLTDSKYASGGHYTARLYLLRRKAESAASGHYPDAGVFLPVVGRALEYAQSQPLSLALALLLLLYAASLLLRAARLGSPGSSAFGKDADPGRSGPGVQLTRTPRSSASAIPSTQPVASSANTDTTGGADGVPGCIVHASGPGTDGEPLVAEEEVSTEPPPVVHGPIAAPDDNAGLVRGVARLLSRAGRDDAAADAAAVFSVLAGDFLGRAKPTEAAVAATQATADREWALEGCDLSPEDAVSAYVEEVFENSRYMPLQGWGSSYPGHLLPTDRRRWSRLDASQCSDVLRELVEIPPGWAWAQPWKKDMRGAEVGAVDSEGWHYAVDFKFLKHPPTEGCGKESTLRCVRRRRWVRVRLPSADAPPPSAVDLASPQRALNTDESSHPPPLVPPEVIVSPVADGEGEDRPSTPVSEPTADGWDCELDLNLPADTSPPLSPPGSDSDDSDSLTPLLERARAVLSTARSSPASPAAASALRSALVAFLDQPEAPSVPPATEPEQPTGRSARRELDRELDQSSFEDEGSLFDLDAGVIAQHGKSAPTVAVPSSQQHARRVVTTPERCEPSPRSSLARSWTDGVRSSFEAAAAVSALD